MIKPDELPVTESRWIKNLHNAMTVLDDIDMDEVVRKTIWRCLRSEMHDALDRFDTTQSHRRAGRPWTKEDDESIRQLFAEAAVPTSWKQERWAVAQLCDLVERPPKTAVKRAIELGLGKFVEYEWRRGEA